MLMEKCRICVKKKRIELKYKLFQNFKKVRWSDEKQILKFSQIFFTKKLKDEANSRHNVETSNALAYNELLNMVRLI